MPKLSRRWRGFGVEIEIPERAAAALRRRKTRSRESASTLEFRQPPPLVLQRPEEAVKRYIDDFRSVLEWYPDMWSGSGEDGEDLAAKVGRLSWYHTLELPGGIVTPGYYDHRPLVPYYGIPDDLRGKRVLDVGSWDGFWSFEFERRGASVVAVDLDVLTKVDFPPAIRNAVLDAKLEQRFGGGFELARRALGSKVERIVRNVYDLDPADVGTFDLVHFSDVSQHLQRPLEAYRRIRSVTAGSAMIVDAFDPDLDDTKNLVEYRGGWVDVTWWIPSLNTLAQLVTDAGFSDVQVQRVYRIDPVGVPGTGRWRAILLATP
jgi:tRNA (mo5U34)-methyltransferase